MGVQDTRDGSGEKGPLLGLTTAQPYPAMITKYFTKVTVKFNPFGPEARSARSVLSQIPPSLKGICQVDLELLNDKSKKEPFVQVTFKDNTVMSGNPAELKLADFTNMFDKHSQKLLFKEEVDK